MATKKKVTYVESKADASAPAPQDWKPTAEAKGKAMRNRLIALVLWALAIGTEAFAIFYLLKHTSMNLFMLWLIVALVVIGALALGGSLLWKQANRYDPAHKSDKVRFFVQNQLGAIITIIAFLPLIILIFLNKDMDGKQKGIAGAIAIVLMLAVGAASIDWNPSSVEQYTQQTAAVKNLTGADQVFWTAHGTKYHLYDDCSAINKDATTEIFKGTVGTAFAECKGLNKDDPLCQFCENRWIKENPGASTTGSTESTGAITPPQ
ncbi:MAG: hypothetical protein FWC54_00020 [Actinomycetia bacterium]|nr:hypothetical protein [Actinomycetes bacterium]